MLSFCVRSSGAIVALPPAAKIASSTCSRSLAVRAVMTTCAPFAASALAVAAPIPRLAPVTSATRPERGWSFIALLGLIQAFCEQCELIDLDRVVLIGERSRIVAGEDRSEERRVGNRWVRRFRFRCGL